MEVDHDDLPRRALRSGRRPLTSLGWLEDRWVTNRERRKAPRAGLMWCSRCDADLVNPGSRCGVCGNVEKPFLLKKDSNA